MADGIGNAKLNVGFGLEFYLFYLAACYSNPCNSGTCYDLQAPNLSLGLFYCVCPAGFTGTQCEKGKRKNV